MNEIRKSRPAESSLGLLRRSLLGMTALGVATVGLGALAQPVEAQTLRAVKHSDLRVLDPIITTAYMSRNHGYMVFDTLVALDANFEVQPQMADWEISDDGMTYRFTLRDGLMFHDGEPVRPADVIASISRWGERDGMGQVLMTYIDSMEGEGDNVVVMNLTQPYGLVLDSLAKPSSNVPFIMPERLANTPSTEAIPEQIGSGPFRFVQDEFQPGVRAVYLKNEDYVPRDEPSSWAAGGKVVNVDRVEWVTMADDQTALSALLAGEIDYWEQPPADLLPILETNPDLVVRNQNELGYQTIGRMNFLHPPFDNQLIRQAALAALNQQDVLDAMIGNPDLYNVCPAMFVCGTPLASDAGAEFATESHMDRARDLLEEAGYDGTPLVIMHPTDVVTLRTQPVVATQLLRDAGFEVDLQAMDWQTLVGRRASQAAPDDGGWNMFFTNWVGADVFNPLVNNMVNGRGAEGGWFGWPDVPEAEELRKAYAEATDPEEQVEYARQLQELAYDEVMYVPVGEYIVPASWSANLEGVLDGPAPFFWNITKN
ncbi:MAG: peptide/nickel transport system substrate-binding protein [Saliniramus fredricksonii]|uniref:Peptide/nickel transport system substrate-binding protein n=1 Tax=Saliniramus fredricksonii TaxID=1653334 RepID=A0A0N8KDJ1_9HYPH|nr:MAG: peptide/nickel transport system substrate-binding protein [Saliniramus fredricksonii]SCC81192.1 peptide/nickel transport system substrate-binding protein [Saliniramus fredricksonii]